MPAPALNVLELAVTSTEPDRQGRRRVDLALRSKTLVQRKFLLYDKSGEEHYNLISALHKSMRDSDPDAALYWLARMLEAGEDPLYVARRLDSLRLRGRRQRRPAGAADCRCAAKDAVHFIGMPEGNTALAQCVVYLATAPKSNAALRRLRRGQKDALKSATEPVPLHLRNAPTG